MFGKVFSTFEVRITQVCDIPSFLVNILWFRIQLGRDSFTQTKGVAISGI